MIQCKKEMYDREESKIETRTNNGYDKPNKKSKKKITREQFMELSGLWDESDQPWTKIEDSQLFELHTALKNNWSGISKFIENRDADEIQQHFYSTLKWAAFEYKNDVDYKTGVLSKQFKNQSSLYLDDPLNASNEELEEFCPVAIFLLNLDVSTTQKKTPLVKNEPVEKKTAESEEDVLAKMYKEKFQTTQKKADKQSIMNSELVKDTEELKKSVDNFWWKQLVNNDDNSNVSASSAESDLSLMLSRKTKKLKAELDE